MAAFVPIPVTAGQTDGDLEVADDQFLDCWALELHHQADKEDEKEKNHELDLGLLHPVSAGLEVVVGQQLAVVFIKEKEDLDKEEEEEEKGP